MHISVDCPCGCLLIDSMLLLASMSVWVFDDGFVSTSIYACMCSYSGTPNERKAVKCYENHEKCCEKDLEGVIF